VYIVHQGGEVHDYSQSAKITSPGSSKDVRREGYKGLLHRGLYTIFFTTRYVKTLSDNNYYSIAVITFYLLRPLKLTNQNQSQIQSVQLFITFAT
jgi:hypothetical protein